MLEARRAVKWWVGTDLASNWRENRRGIVFNSQKAWCGRPIVILNFDNGYCRLIMPSWAEVGRRHFLCRTKFSHKLLPPAKYECGWMYDKSSFWPLSNSFNKECLASDDWHYLLTLSSPRLQPRRHRMNNANYFHHTEFKYSLLPCSWYLRKLWISL